MGCGCGGQRKVQVSRGQPTTVRAGVRALPQNKKVVMTAYQNKRCPKCRWPMSMTRRYTPTTNHQMQIWTCLNKGCNHKEEK